MLSKRSLQNTEYEVLVVQIHKTAALLTALEERGREGVM